MWTEKKFNVTRREASTKRPFGEVVAAIEARAPVVQDRLDALVTQDIKAEDLRRQIENHLGPSGFALFMKVEHDVIMARLGRTHRSVQYAIGNPLRAKDVSDAAPGAALYTPLRIAVIENEEDGSTSILFDSAESLMGSFGSDVAREIGRSLDQKLVGAAEQAVHVEAAEEAT
jgi:uncharacterized protein (DUF302 family)